MNLLRDQSAALRARPPLACPHGMSRGSLRDALHYIRAASCFRASSGLFMALLALLVIFPAQAADLAPQLDIGKGGQCVEDPAFMRANHMKLIIHQRDETVRKGMRGSKYSLANCVECHASKTNNSVLGSNRNFCQGCHAYAAVKIDCFECHSSKRKVVATAIASTANNHTRRGK
jgi:hypothetical protein